MVIKLLPPLKINCFFLKLIIIIRIIILIIIIIITTIKYKISYSIIKLTVIIQWGVFNV